MDYLAWILAFVLSHPLPPSVVVDSRPLFWGCPPTSSAIINMHWGRTDGTRLFARAAGWEFQHCEVASAYASLLSDPVFRLVWASGAPNAIAQHDLWVERYNATRQEYMSKPYSVLRDIDIEAVKFWLAEDGDKLEVSQTPFPGFAQALGDGNIKVAISSITESMPDRSTLLHEATHHVQMMIKTITYTNHWDYEEYNTPELGAMIIENCARIAEGWDEADFVDMDHSQYPGAKEPLWNRYSFPPPRPPAMPASLVYQYYLRYGPQFTGDLARDLEKLRTWVPRFERIGMVVFPAKCPNWIERARSEERVGLLDPLASTCQTWLAVNGQTSLYEKVIHGKIPDETAPDVPLTEATAKALLDREKVPADAQKAALDFIKRCNGTP